MVPYSSVEEWFFARRLQLPFGVYLFEVTGDQVLIILNSLVARLRRRLWLPFAVALALLIFMNAPGQTIFPGTDPLVFFLGILGAAVIAGIGRQTKISLTPNGILWHGASRNFEDLLFEWKRVRIDPHVALLAVWHQQEMAPLGANLLFKARVELVRVVEEYQKIIKQEF